MRPNPHLPARAALLTAALLLATGCGTITRLTTPLAQAATAAFTSATLADLQLVGIKTGPLIPLQASPDSAAPLILGEEARQDLASTLGQAPSASSSRSRESAKPPLGGSSAPPETSRSAANRSPLTPASPSPATPSPEESSSSPPVSPGPSDNPLFDPEEHHMTTTKTAPVLVALTLAVLLGACESTLTEPNEEKAAPATLCETGPYLIHLSGQCRVASNRRIVCEDETTTTPRDKVLNVVFQLRNADTGAPVETKSVSPGAVPREVSFSGLTAGAYEVRHTVQAKDCAATFTTYASLEAF